MPVTRFEDKAKDILSKLEKIDWKYDRLKSSLNGKCSFEELFTIVFDLEETQELHVPFLLQIGKNEVLADKVRKDGTDYYKKKEYLNALDRYSFSILNAPHPMIISKEESESGNPVSCVDSSTRITTEKYGGFLTGDSTCLAMGYANRSAVLIKLKKYDECLRDIDLALKYGYPEKLRKVLEDRKLKCLNAQKRRLEQQDVQRGACSDSMQDMNALSQKLSKVRLINGPQQLLSVISEIQFQDAEEEMWKMLLSFKDEEPPKLGECNTKVPSFSSALRVSYHPSKGRYVIATRNIRPGEVLGAERAYCASLQDCSVLNHCSSCLSFCVSPLPCPRCAEAIFCSESCRTKYLEEDHWLECVILPSVLALGLVNQKMIYKVLKNMNYHQLCDTLKELQMEKHKNPETFGFDKDGVFNSSSYRTVHYLHSNIEKLPFEALFAACLQSLAVTRLLQLSRRFFIDESGESFEPTKEDLIKTGAVLLANIFKYGSNGHLVINYKMGKTIGSAIYPALSLINHDCNPSAFGYNKGRMRVLRALKPILRGEEVTVSYTKDFQEQDEEERRKELEDCGFTCSCEACTKHWPLFAKLPIYELKSTANAARKEKSQILQKISNALVLSFKIRSNFTDDKITKQDFDSLCEAIEMMYKYVSVPCQNICSLQVSLMMCFLAGF